ncbi:hypothetical protein EOM86_11055 [Candidatus Nomurabacteria bacterium]|nr:hypothetical protein [Candidatus Nomurabacteria bacterium]
MVHKNVVYGKTEGVTLVRFGEGDIEMVVGGDEGKVGTLALKGLEKPRPIGELCKHGYKSFDDMKPDAVIEFENAEAIDALIESLIEVRSVLAGEQQEQKLDDNKELNNDKKPEDE